MSTRILNPEAIRDFAGRLRQFTTETRQGINDLGARLRDLGDTEWADETQRQYMQEFETAVRQMMRAIEEFDNEQSRRLEGLAQQAEQVSY